MTDIYICGNPPFAGSDTKTPEQRIEMANLYGKRVHIAKTDYVSCWFIKGGSYIRGYNNAKIGFVTTNSITQGTQASIVWPLVLEDNLEIFFGYESFRWANNARQKAGVVVTVIGLRNKSDEPKYMYSKTEKRIVQNISPYLKTESNNPLVVPYFKIPKGLPKCEYGTKKADGGFLVLENKDRDILLSQYPESKKLIRKFVGSEEFIKGHDRWILWISDDNLSFAESIPPIMERLIKVKNFRETSKITGDAYKLREKFWQPREFPNVDRDSIIIPRVSSETREYIPIGYLPAGTVISDSAFAIYDAPEWLFAILTSRMHMAWVKAVAGRLGTSYRYSNTLCYNTFPFPALNESQKRLLEESARRIIMAREEHYDMTMAQLYDRSKMPDDLRIAHNLNDLLVDTLYRRSGFANDEERLQELFRRYEENKNA